MIMKGIMMRTMFTMVYIILFIAISNANGADVPRTLYVMNGSAKTLSKMNLENSQITNDVLALGDVPNQVIAHQKRIYVVKSEPPEIMIINPLCDQVEKRIALVDTSNPWFMDFVSDERAYVTNWLLNTVSVVDLESGVIVREIPVGPRPQGVLVLGDTAFVTNSGVDTSLAKYDASSVSVIDVNADTVTTTLAVPINAQDLALGPDGRVYVVCTGDYVSEAGKICIIDRWAGPDGGPAVVDTVEIGGAPGDIIVTADGQAYLCDWGDFVNGFLYNYDIYADTVYHNSSDPIRVGDGAMRLFYDQIEDVIYVNNYMDDAVQRFCPHGDTVIATYGFGDGAQDMTIMEAYMGPIDDLTIIKDEGTFQLSWTAKSGVDIYRIYSDDLDPYFTPTTPADSTTEDNWMDPAPPTESRYYLVRARKGAEENEDSNRVGAFDKSLGNMK
jgi:YVTN family beta-propeller protein